MRVIKFKAKCVDSGEWIAGNLVSYREDDGRDIVCIVSDHRNEIDACLEFTEVDPDTVCQFTGLYDSKGREIYEGDIVEVYDFTSVYASKYRGVVRMYRGSWCVEYKDSTFDTVFHPMLFFDDFADRKTEVIGNVFDNRRLLKTLSNEQAV